MRDDGYKENLRQYRSILMQKDNKSSQAHRLSIIEQEKYVWKDDLSRVDSTMQDRSVSSYQDVSVYLNHSGESVNPATNKDAPAELL